MEKVYNPLPALRRFALAITVLNIAGHFFLGFEQSWAYPLAALATTYSLELLYEYLFATANHKPPRFSGSWKNLVNFLLPAHITGMATSMLLFANSDLSPIVFASAAAISSKVIFRIIINGKSRHFLNPSNTGIALTLIMFSWVGISPPYMFTENVTGWGDWIIPAILVTAGTFLNFKFTGRIPLILAWLTGFVAQAVLRSIFFDVSLTAALLPCTGVAFLLFTFYMISDPATTPSGIIEQMLYAFSVAMVYGLLMIFHVVFGLFFALFIVCILRGILLSIPKVGAAKYALSPRLNISSSGLTYEK
ncbi:hypothetical protein SIO70_14465 [Chitinophaga sancti]|uniref:hypothetical protein n=1 Tax=Chitinophaga sancti TaxID=1004 RepID=UPI002A75E84F|nr:hypothetical protein [Chitinophaga sancti]WPQ66062.1 hypothetical protein SIO70_14465 [Chitinophaga sancti]